MEKFARAINVMAMIIIHTPQKPTIPLTDKEQRKHDRANHCHICEKKFSHNKKRVKYRKYCKVKDHDHYTGKYRGAAHSICNLHHKE